MIEIGKTYVCITNTSDTKVLTVTPKNEADLNLFHKMEQTIAVHFEEDIMKCSKCDKDILPNESKIQLLTRSYHPNCLLALLKEKKNTPQQNSSASV
jgi:hypothetical protein